MSQYPPSSSSHPFAGEEFELPSYNHSSPPQHSPRPSPLRQRPSLPRVLTIHPSQSTSHLLFAAPSTSPHASRHKHVRSGSLAQSDDGRRRAQFLHEDLQTEEVHLPDFGQMLGFAPETEEDHYAAAQRMTSRWKRRLYMLMEEPNSGREAFFVHVIVTGAIIFSAILTTFSTLPSFHTNPSSIRTLFGLDTTIVVLFTVEYIVRSLAHSDTWTQYYNWSTSFFGLLDLISILPYYIEVARNEDTSILFRFSILRTFRLLRVFRAFKYQNQMLLTIEVMYVAVYRSKDALLALSFFLLLVLVFFSTLIYFAERGTWDSTLGGFVDADGDPSAFDSIPQTAWFSLVTMSTVGYGEVVPKSFLGKVLTVPLLMFGLLLIALPSFVLGRNFAIVFDAMTSQLNKGSEAESPRESFSQPPSPSPHTDPQADSLLMRAATHSPRLPGQADSFTNHVNPNQSTLTEYPNPYIKKLGQSPNLSSDPSGVFSSGPRGQTRMWDGEGLPETKTSGKERDLTNIKLAKNQLVLLEQIDSLRQTIDKQGDMLARLMSALEVSAPSKRDDIDPTRSKGKSRTEPDAQFAVEDSDEEGQTDRGS